MSPRSNSVLGRLLPTAVVAMLAVGGLGVLLWRLDTVVCYLGLSANEKLDIVRVYLLAVGGLLLILQIHISNRRADSAERTAQLTALGNITERLNQAIDNIGSSEAVKRTGALYQLHHIAREAPDYRLTVFRIAEARLRSIAAEIESSSDADSTLVAEMDTITEMLYQRIDAGGLYYGET